MRQTALWWSMGTQVMVRAMALGALISMLAVLLVVVGASTAPATPASADSGVWFCVEDSTRSQPAVRVAVVELDSTPELRVTYHRGDGCPSRARLIVVAEVDPRDGAPLAWTTYAAPDHGRPQRAVVTLTTDSHAQTEHELMIVVLHELMHAIIHPTGPSWDTHAHTTQCASVMSRDRACVWAQSGLTDYDRAEIAREYADS